MSKVKIEILEQNNSVDLLTDNTAQDTIIYGVRFHIDHQSFTLDYWGSKEEAEWMGEQIKIALDRMGEDYYFKGAQENQTRVLPMQNRIAVLENLLERIYNLKPTCETCLHPVNEHSLETGWCRDIDCPCAEPIITKTIVCECHMSPDADGKIRLCPLHDIQIRDVKEPTDD